MHQRSIREHKTTKPEPEALLLCLCPRQPSAQHICNWLRFLQLDLLGELHREYDVAPRTAHWVSKWSLNESQASIEGTLKTALRDWKVTEKSEACRLYGIKAEFIRLFECWQPSCSLSVLRVDTATMAALVVFMHEIVGF